MDKDTASNNLSTGTYAERTAKTPVKLTAKEAAILSKEPVVSRMSEGINLLSDTGLALKRAQAKFWLMRVSLSVMFMSLIFMGGTFGFWFIADRQQRSVANQISVLEQRLATLEDVENLVVAYKNRLQTISGLVSSGQEAHKPGSLEREIDRLAGSVNGKMTAFEFGKDSLKGVIEVSSVGNMEQVLHDLRKKEEAGLWSKVVITRLFRPEFSVYGVEFTASLVTKAPVPTTAPQPAG